MKIQSRQSEQIFQKSAAPANSKISEFRFSNLCFDLTDQYGSFSLLLHLQAVFSGNWRYQYVA